MEALPKSIELRLYDHLNKHNIGTKRFLVKDLTQEFYLSSVIFYVGEKQSGFLESSDGDIKTLVANAVPENTKKIISFCAVWKFMREL